MKINVQDIEEFLNIDIEPLTFLKQKFFLLDYKLNKIMKVDLHRLLLGLHTHEVLVLNWNSPQDWEARPSPSLVDAKKIKVLEHALTKVSAFKKISFDVVVSGTHISVFYEKELVYQEPIFIVFSYLYDDEEDEDFYDNPWVKKSLFFQDWRASLLDALQLAYGKPKKCVLNNIAEYPEMNVSKNISETIEEALSGVDDNLVVLRYLLQAKPDTQLQDFVQLLDDSIDNVDEVVDILFDLYIKYCGISIGIRTAIWDAMVGCYNYFEPEKDFDEVIALIEARFERRKATEWQNMDIAITSNAFTIARLVSLLDEEPDCKTNIAIALFCFAKTTSTHLLDEI